MKSLLTAVLALAAMHVIHAVNASDTRRAGPAIVTHHSGALCDSSCTMALGAPPSHVARNQRDSSSIVALPCRARVAQSAGRSIIGQPRYAGTSASTRLTLVHCFVEYARHERSGLVIQADVAGVQSFVAFACAASDAIARI
jgi:hypothetical protein